MFFSATSAENSAASAVICWTSYDSATAANPKYEESGLNNRRRRFMFRIIERSLRNLRSDSMSDGFDGDFNFDLCPRADKVALHRCQCDHFFQEWRPGCRGGFTDLCA